MDSEIIWIGGAAVGIAILAFLLSHLWSMNKFSDAQTFEYDGVMFWWIPERRPSWFSTPYEYGRFEYEDGTRVKDARLHREIHEAWMIHNRPRSS